MDKEKVELQLKFTPNYSKYSVLLNCYRVGGMKWNDVDGAIFHKIDLNKEEVLSALGVKQKIADTESKLAEERKKVVQEIKKVLDNKASYSTDEDDDWLIQIKESSLYEILDQLDK